MNTEAEFHNAQGLINDVDPQQQRSARRPRRRGAEPRGRAGPASATGSGTPLKTGLLRRLAHGFGVEPEIIARVEMQLALELYRIARGKSGIQAPQSDRRFRHEIWQRNGYYRRVMQAYLAWARSLDALVDSLDMSDRARARARFVAMQIVEALSPTNFPATNPGFLGAALESRGKSVVAGLRNLVDDIRHNNGMPRQVEEKAFRVGRNIACTPGAVVFRNEIFELLQYAPATGQVRAVPMLVVPPQINKYYIVDIAPGRSFVEYAVSQGLQVFCMSWRNPTARHREWDLDTYHAAVKEAIDITCDVTGSDSVSLSGGCAGGTTAAGVAGQLTATGEAHKISSLTLLVTILDTSAETVMSLFANHRLLEAARGFTHRRGVLDGHQTRRAFSWLRPGDLVWGYVANNYLMGKQPPAFDVLYWNSDSTRLPARFHSDLLDFFEENPLARPGAFNVLGTPVDLNDIKCDTYMVAGISDHITPWHACYLGTRMFGGKVDFVLSSSGHIQSLVNPPGNSKAKFYTGRNYRLAPEQWLARAKPHEGSWWEHWAHWMQSRTGRSHAPAGTLGNERYPLRDAAPGMYVHQR